MTTDRGTETIMGKGYNTIAFDANTTPAELSSAFSVWSAPVDATTSRGSRVALTNAITNRTAP